MSMDDMMPPMAGEGHAPQPVHTVLPDCDPGGLAGPSEMAARMHAHAWSATPLGPRVGWPQSLHTVVGLALASPLPMIVLWDASLVQIYNDGYAEVAGAKHPMALGQATQECWPEVWDFNGPIYDAALRGAEV